MLVPLLVERAARLLGWEQASRLLYGEAPVDERLRVFLWMLASGAGLALVGAAFGAVTGVSTWRDGRVGGTFLGWAVARAFARVSDREQPPAWQGALVGGTDGAVFLGLLGTALGFVLAWMGWEWHVLRTILIGAALLAVAACAFGLLATRLVRLGLSNLYGIFHTPFGRPSRLPDPEREPEPPGDGASGITRPPDGFREP